MPREPRPRDQEQQPAGAALFALVVQSYEHDFTENGARAEAARRRGQEVLVLMLTELGNGGMTPDNARVQGMDEERMRRFLEWAAFDYSVAGEESIETVSTTILVTPVFAGLLGADFDFTQVTEDLESTIIAMRLYRQQNGLGPVAANPTGAFVRDMQAVAGPILPE
jgi:hypothetical protein